MTIPDDSESNFADISKTANKSNRSWGRSAIFPISTLASHAVFNNGLVVEAIKLPYFHLSLTCQII